MTRNPKSRIPDSPTTTPMADIVHQTSPPPLDDAPPHVRPQGIPHIVLAVLQASRNLPTTHHRAVYQAIAAYSDKDGSAWPTEKQIAMESACSERTVRNVIPDLVDLGEIAVTKEAVTAGPHIGVLHNIYHLQLAAAGWEPPSLLPVEEANRPMSQRARERIAALEIYIAELESRLGMEPAAGAHKGRSSYTPSSPIDISTDNDDRYRQQVPVSTRVHLEEHPRYEEVRAAVDKHQEKLESWENLDKAVEWYLLHLVDFDKQRENWERRERSATRRAPPSQEGLAEYLRRRGRDGTGAKMEDPDEV